MRREPLVHLLSRIISKGSNPVARDYSVTLCGRTVIAHAGRIGPDGCATCTRCIAMRLIEQSALAGRGTPPHED